MKNFSDWIRQPIKMTGSERDLQWINDLQNENVHQELIDHNLIGTPITELTYPCCGCGEETHVEEPVCFDPSFHYCGKDPRCCP